MKIETLPYTDIQTAFEHPVLLEDRGLIFESLDCLDAQSFCCISGDVKIDGDLDEAWVRDITEDDIIVIRGNLEVSGDIVLVHDPLSYLYPGRKPADIGLLVLGNVSCRSLFTGYAYPFGGGGNVSVAECVLLHDDHAPAAFGALYAPVAIADQWNLCGDLSNVGVCSCERWAGPGTEWPDPQGQTPEYFVPEVLSSVTVVNEVEVADRLRKGLPVLLDEHAVAIAPASNKQWEPPKDDDREAAYRKAIGKDPKNAASIGDLVTLLAAQDRMNEVAELIADIDESIWGRTHGKLEAAWLKLQTQAKFEPSKIADRYADALAAAEEQRWEDAFKDLVFIVSVNRSFGDDIARITLIRLFEIAGPDTELVREWRHKMGAAMY